MAAMFERYEFSRNAVAFEGGVKAFLILMIHRGIIMSVKYKCGRRQGGNIQFAGKIRFKIIVFLLLFGFPFRCRLHPAQDAFGRGGLKVQNFSRAWMFQLYMHRMKA